VLSTFAIRRGDCLASLRELGGDSVHCVVTSPPYWGLRDYRADGQIGLETSPAAYVGRLVEVFREVRRVLRPDGTLWLNLGDCYAQGGRGTPGGPASTLNGARWCHDEANRAMKARGESYRRPPPGFKPKDLMGLPWRVALALQADGWYLRSDLIWWKPNAMPEPIRDRPTRAHEYLFLLSRSEHYFYDSEAIKEPVTDDDRIRRGTETRNKRSVWPINSSASGEAGHFATFPEDLVRPCILAGTSQRGVCPECGAPIARRVKRIRTLDGLPTKLPAFRNTSKGEPSTRQGVGHHRIGTITRTLGWKRTCDHDQRSLAPAPAMVLDPFSGTATTGAVALKLGRSYLGLELNPTYAENSERRLGNVAPLFTGRVA
jgi:DNA modification methylase